jgi:hypothetical protein
MSSPESVEEILRFFIAIKLTQFICSFKQSVTRCFIYVPGKITC